MLFAECGKRGPPGPGGEVADRDLGVGAVGHDVKQFGFRRARSRRGTWR